MATTMMQPFVPSKSVTIELPSMLGTLQIKPIKPDYLSLRATALLINTTLYGFSATMRRAGDRWYFHNKAEIGVVGGRPAPKYAQAALLVIADTVNDALKNNPEVQEQMRVFQEQERQLQERIERERLKTTHNRLKDSVRLTLIDIASCEMRLKDYQQRHDEAVKALEAFEFEHPTLSVEQPALGEG
jgi:uncharacterized membrane protein